MCSDALGATLFERLEDACRSRLPDEDAGQKSFKVDGGHSDERLVIRSAVLDGASHSPLRYSIGSIGNSAGTLRLNPNVSDQPSSDVISFWFGCAAIGAGRARELGSRCLARSRNRLTR
jgi:hypothetical protein